MNPIYPLIPGPIHIIGMGGIGMSGIAELLRHQGYVVQGSDLSENANVQRLREAGLTVYIGQDASHIKAHLGVVVCSTAVKEDNPEVVEAKRLNIPVISRAEMLSELMRSYLTIAISGTHGKTTTTSLVGKILESLDPTVINGGIVNSYGNNVKIGGSHWMVVEADESDGTFVRVPTSIVVVTNIDPEHLDYYKTFESLKDHFNRFIHQIAFYGFAVVCYDSPAARELVDQSSDKRVITYGFHEKAQVRGINLRPTLDGTFFDVTFQGVDFPNLQNVFLPMMGAHNVQNALAAILVALKMGIEPAQITERLSVFQGVKRRFTKTGTFRGMTVIDDYAHHPAEIEAVLKAARQATGGRVLAVVQPHRYSRLADLFEDFALAFREADMICVTPVFSAGEAPRPGIDHIHLAQLMQRHFSKPIFLCENFEDVVSHLKDQGQEGDLAVFLGAGNITKWAHDLPLMDPTSTSKGRA